MAGASADASAVEVKTTADDEDGRSYSDPAYVMPESHEVVVCGEMGEETVLRVHVEKATKAKPYLGGYRHKKTGVTYHHASSQSIEHALIPPRRSVENLRNRDTQTFVPAPLDPVCARADGACPSQVRYEDEVDSERARVRDANEAGRFGRGRRGRPGARE